MDIYSLIKDLLNVAEKISNDELYSKLIDIKKQVNELDEENQRLNKLLDIRDKISYDEGAQSFTLSDTPNVHFCSVCYGHNGKLIPMTHIENRGYVCRICDEIWFKHLSRT